MSVTLPNMSLTQWDLASDIFSRAELADNFDRIDEHNHTTGKGVQVPTGGIVNGAVTADKLAANAVDVTKVLDGSLTDAKLASPSSGTWRTLWHGTFKFTSSNVASTYWSGADGTAVRTTSPLGTPVSVLYWNPADYAVAGKTTKMRVAGVLLTNQIAPAANFTAGLSVQSTAPFSAASTMSMSGSPVAGSTVTVTAPTGSGDATPVSPNPIAGAEFTAPAAQVYYPHVAINATPAGGSMTVVNLAVQIRYV